MVMNLVSRGSYWAVCSSSLLCCASQFIFWLPCGGWVNSKVESVIFRSYLYLFVTLCNSLLTTRMSITWPHRPALCVRPNHTSRFSRCVNVSSSRRRGCRAGAWTTEMRRWWWRSTVEFDGQWWHLHRPAAHYCAQMVELYKSVQLF